VLRVIIRDPFFLLGGARGLHLRHGHLAFVVARKIERQLIARQVIKILWTTQLVGSPPSFLDFLVYLCVADGSKARRELGFTPQLSIKRTILDFLGISSEDGATDIATAQA